MPKLPAYVVLLGLPLVGCRDPHTWPEDQDNLVDGPLDVTAEWQTVTFDDPLQITEEGRQRLHLALDGERFEPNHEYDPEDYPNQFNPRRDDGVLIQPDIFLVGDNGDEVRIYGTGQRLGDFGRRILAFGTHDGNFEDAVSPLPEIPDDIKEIEALRIRSNEPFTIEALHWSVDDHPDIHRCGRRCTWLDRWLRGE